MHLSVPDLMYISCSWVWVHVIDYWYIPTYVYCIVGNVSGTKFSQMAPKIKIPGYNVCRCWLTMQNKSAVMPNSRILFSRMLGQLRYVQKLCPVKIFRYTVCTNVY